MPTVIDQLIVELQLDPKKFSEGQREATKELRRMETEAGKHQQRLARETDKYTQSLGLLQGKLLAIAAIFTGGMGIERFLSHVAQATSQTGYLAKSLGVSTRELGTWQSMAASVGSTAAEMTQGFQSIKNALADWQINRAGPLAEFSWNTQQSGNGPGVELSPRDSVTTVIQKITRWHDAQIAAGQDPAVINRMIGNLGLPQGMINAIGLGSEGLNARLKQFGQFAPTEDDAKAFQELSVNMAQASQQAEKLGRAVALLATPGVIRFLESLNRIVEAFVKGGWISGLSQLDKEASAGVGEATSSVGVDASSIGEKANQGWWGRFKSKFEWHNPFASRGAPITDNGDGPGGAAGGVTAAQTPTASTKAAPGAAGPGSSEFLRQRRQRYADEIANTPGLRDRVGGMLALEGTAQPTMESLLNRIDYVNTERAKRGQAPKSIDDMLTSGFYGPINRGQLPGGIASYRRNPGKFDRAIDRALGGSHMIGGYTDQGLPTDPNGSARNAARGLYFPYQKIGGNEFTDWAGGPRSRRGASDYREMVEAGLAKEAASASAAKNKPNVAGGAEIRVRATRQDDLVPTAASRTFDNWGAMNSLNLGARGALMGANSSVNNSRSSTVNIASMPVSVPPGASPTEYGAGIQQTLQRNSAVNAANEGLW